MDIHMSAAIVAFQGLTVCLYWIMVPRKRKWDNRKTYMVAVMLYLLWWAFCLPTIIQNDSMGKALEEHDFWNVVKLIGGIGIEVATSWIVSADSAHNRLLVAGVNVFLLVGFEVVGDIITYCLMSGEIWQSNASYHIGQTLFSVFFLLGTTIFAVYWNRMEKQMRRKIILLSVLFCGCQCFFMYSLWHLNRTAMEASIQYYIVLSGVVTVIADYLIFDILTSTMEAQRREMELEQLRQQQETQYQYYQLVQENAQEMSKLRHDFKNQLQVVYSLLDTNKEQTIHMLDEMNRRISSTHPVLYCVAPVVNAVITVKADAARQRGIAFDAAVDLDDWEIEEIDQSNLFSNLLDNALEGCLPGQPNQFISLGAGEKKGIYAVKVQNSCDPAKTLRPGQTPGTAKQNRTHHGFGLKILQSIAEKYGGELRIHCENGVFTAEVFLENRRLFP